MKKLNSICLIFLLSILVNATCIAQEDSLIGKKIFKNTISYNVTNTLILGGKAQVFCYERLVGKHQSFAFEFGSFSVPKFSILPSTIKANSESEQTGIKLAFDYRFYLASENKYNAPRGIYIAPFYSYNYFNRKNSFIIDTTSTNVSAEVGVSTDFTLRINTIGAQLGYQFVFWKRLAVDLILIGPGLSIYTLNAELDTSLDPDDESELFTAINDALAEKIPGYSLVIKPGEFKKDGSANTTSIGFRYVVHVGFRF